MIEPLWQHQQLAIEKSGARFAFLFDPGTGKTRTTIEKLNGISECQKVVIFAPLNVCRNWEKELQKYGSRSFKIFMVAGQPKSKKMKELMSFRDCKVEDCPVLICNTETLRGKDYRSVLYASKASFVIADEAHQFKTHSSLQTKGLLELDRVCKPNYFYWLTGTPSPQGYIDLWSMLYLMKKTKDTFFIWRKKHFDDLNERRKGYPGYYPKYVLNKFGKAEIEKALSECSITARIDEVLNLPDLLRTSLYCELSSEQQKHYDTMKEFLFAIDKEGHELNAANVLSRTLRLQQILAGEVGEIVIKDNPRIEALKLAIQKCGEAQFIIWTIFKSTYKAIGELLEDTGIAYGFLTGEQSAEVRHKAMEDFQSGKLKCLVAHPKAGGIGVNLTAAAFSIHYTRSFSLVDDMQAEARNYRGGSEIHKRIVRIDIIASNTIDEDITEALREKKTVQDFVMGLKRGCHGK